MICRSWEITFIMWFVYIYSVICMVVLSIYITTCDSNNKMLTDLQVHPQPCFMCYIAYTVCTYI